MDVALCKTVWHMGVDQYTGFKASSFYSRKHEYLEPLCQTLLEWEQRGLGIKYVQHDDASENKAFIKLAKWHLCLVPEFMGAITPQCNQLVKLGFTSVSAKARSMLSRANLPLHMRYMLCHEALSTVMHLSNLQVVERNGNLLTRYEHFFGEAPRYATMLWKFGEAGTVKIGMNGKLEGHKIPMISVGYALDHSQHCYCMYNPSTQQIHIAKDITWLQCMYYTKLGGDIGIKLIVNPILPSVSGYWEGEQSKFLPDGSIEDESFQEGHANGIPDSNQDGFQPVLSATGSGRVRTRPSKLQGFERQYHAARIDGVISSIQTNIYSTRCDLEGKDLDMHEVGEFGAGIGGGFDNTSELQVMNYQQAYFTDAEGRKCEINNEHNQMICDGVWEAVEKTDLP